MNLFFTEKDGHYVIFGYEFPSSASAERGTAVESGLHMLLRGMDKQEATERMFKIYDDNCSNLTDTKVEEERANLVPLLDLGLQSSKKTHLNGNYWIIRRK